MKRVIEWINWYLPPIIWMGMMFWISDQSNLPGQADPLRDFLFKKFAHMIEYGILFWLWRRSQSYWISLGMVFAYACFDELHQSLVPNRFPRLSDIGIDLMGAILVSQYFQAKRMILTT